MNCRCDGCGVRVGLPHAAHCPHFRPFRGERVRLSECQRQPALAEGARMDVERRG